MLIGGKEDPVSVAQPVRVIGECAEPQEIGGGVQDQPLLRIDAFAPTHLLGDRVQQRITQPSQIDPAGHRISLDGRE
jgi:hypothetical protein